MEGRGRWLQALKVAIAAWVIAKAYAVIKAWAELRRRHNLLCQLPAIHGPGEGVLVGYAGGPRFLGDKPVSLDAIRNGLVGGLRKIVQSDAEVRKNGLIHVWYLNSKLSRTVPNTLSTVAVFGMSKVRKLLATKNQPALTKGTSYQVASQLIGRSVLASSGEEWAHQRAILDLGFKDDIMKASIPDITVVVNKMVDKWCRSAENGTPINVSEETLKMTMDVLGQFAFSYDFGSVVAPTTADAPLYESFNTILQVLNTRVMVPPLHAMRDLKSLPFNKEFDAAIAKLDKVVADIVHKRKQGSTRARSTSCGESTGCEPRDLLDIMLMQTSEGLATHAKPMSDEQIIWNIKTMLFAGHDTTANALTWFLYLLTTHPDALRRVRDEYQSVLGTTCASADPTFEQLDECIFLNAVVLEGLRLYPSAGFTKNTLEDFDLEGHIIPKGTEILLLPYLTQRDPDYFNLPNDFIPDRWYTDERLKPKDGVSLKAHLSAVGIAAQYMPFSLGVRNCVGRLLAVNELRVALIKILQRLDFEFVPNPAFQEDPTLWMTLNPCGIILKASIR